MRASPVAMAALAILVLVWGYSWIIMKQVMAYAAPLDFAALRYFGGAMVLFVFILVTRRRLKPPPLLPTLLVGLAQTAAFQGLVQWALLTGGAGKVSLFAYTMPFWVVLFAWWWLGDKPGISQWWGLLLAALGLTLVIAPWLGLQHGLSVVLAIGGGIAWAIGTVLSKRLFTRQRISPINFTAWQMLLGSLVLGLLAWQVPARPIDWTPAFIFGLVYSIFLASSLAWVLWSVVVQQLPATIAGLSSLLVPVCAIILAWLILDETPTGTDIAGMVLILVGLLVVRLRRRSHTHKASPSPDPGE